MMEFSLSVQYQHNEVHHAGTAFWLGHKHILTCAHVLQEALAPPLLGTSLQPSPDDVFVLREARGTRRLIQCRLHPEGWGPQVDQHHDTALLEVIDPALAYAGEIQLQTVDLNREWSFRAFGFPHDRGENSTGHVIGTVTHGRVQLDGQSQGRIRQGYSGSAVCLEESATVIGMLSEASSGPDKTAYMIPVPVFAEFARLAGTSVAARGAADTDQVTLQDIPDTARIHRTWLEDAFVDLYAQHWSNQHSAYMLLDSVGQEVHKAVAKKPKPQAHYMQSTWYPQFETPLKFWQQVFLASFLVGPKATYALLTQLPEDLVPPPLKPYRQEFLRQLREGKAYISRY